MRAEQISTTLDLRVANRTYGVRLCNQHADSPALFRAIEAV
jgi:hypothetical protein